MAAMLSRLIVMLSLVAFSGLTTAETNRDVDECMAKAAAHHRVDLKLLRAIAKVESGMNPKAIGKNKNGTSDTGLMQINDWWLPTLSKFGIKKGDLLDACTSAYVGAWILAKSIQQHGLTWRAVGAYNSPTPKNQQIYADKVNKALAQQP
ncbi:lytic transglycosylase domain-containing protein [Pseudomonas juntendi]|uniref:lytic transglycosylase domain-containing protein n=1 Tax=Pseudomonas juntendi TaxID=2666183 RepID=UPI003B9386E4